MTGFRATAVLPQDASERRGRDKVAAGGQRHLFKPLAQSSMALRGCGSGTARPCKAGFGGTVKFTTLATTEDRHYAR
jgi:hypothetical protein